MSPARDPNSHESGAVRRGGRTAGDIPAGPLAGLRASASMPAARQPDCEPVRVPSHSPSGGVLRSGLGASRRALLADVLRQQRGGRLHGAEREHAHFLVDDRLDLSVPHVERGLDLTLASKPIPSALTLALAAGAVAKNAIPVNEAIVMKRFMRCALLDARFRAMTLRRGSERGIERDVGHTPPSGFATVHMRTRATHPARMGISQTGLRDRRRCSSHQH